MTARRTTKRSTAIKKATPRNVQAVQRQREALELRKAGATYDDIAQQLGYADASGARNAVLSGMNKVLREGSDELRTVQYERLNHMLMVLWPDINQGDQGAINTAIRIMGEMNNLMGVQGPAQQHDVNIQHKGAVLVIEGNEDSYIEMLKRARGELPATQPEVSNAATVEAVDDDDGVEDAEVVDDGPSGSTP